MYCGGGDGDAANSCGIYPFFLVYFKFFYGIFCSITLPEATFENFTPGNPKKMIFYLHLIYFEFVFHSMTSRQNQTKLLVP